MKKIDIQFLVENSKNFKSLESVSQKHFLLYVINLCEIELSCIRIDIKNKIFEYKPFFTGDEFSTIYFSTGFLDIVSNLQEEFKGSYIAKTFEIFSETVSFVDQLPFENLLDITEETRLEILKKIKALRKDIVLGTHI